MANGNPYYIEVCAKALDVPAILSRDGPGRATLSLAPGGAEALKRLEKPSKVIGYIKECLGSLGPEEKLVVQVL